MGKTAFESKIFEKTNFSMRIGIDVYTISALIVLEDPCTILRESINDLIKHKSFPSNLLSSSCSERMLKVRQLNGCFDIFVFILSKTNASFELTY